MEGKRIIWLRAVNVGGAKLPMAQLRMLLTELGAREVQTYIQSGNVVCTPPGDPEQFDRAVEHAINARFGFLREAISRTPEEVRAALGAYPFDAHDSDDQPKHAYIAFMNKPPTAAAVAKARGYDTGADAWEVIGRELHLFYAQGAGQPELNSAAIARALAVPFTSRNLTTIKKVLDLAAD